MIGKPRWLDRRLTLGSFPAVFEGAVGLGAFAFQNGIDHPGTVAATVGVAALLVVLLKRVHPHEPTWNRSHGDVRTDLLHALVTMITLPELLRPARFGLLHAASAWLTARIGWRVWPSGWPLRARDGGRLRTRA